MTEDKFENQPVPEETAPVPEEAPSAPEESGLPETAQTPAEQPAEDEFSVDELIRSTREDLNRYDALIGAAPAAEDPSDRPARELPVHVESFEESAEDEEEELSGWRGMPFGVRTFIYVTAVLIVSMAVAIGVWMLADDVCALTGNDRNVTFTVADNFTVDEVAMDLKQAGLLDYEWLFKIYCTMAKAETKIRPGTYDLNELFDYHALVNALSSVGQRTTVSVTIPEGYECEDIFALLESKGVCSAAELREAAAYEEFDYAFLSPLRPGDPKRLEGCLFPDTYEFYVDDEPRSVLNKFLKNTDRKLTEELWEALDELNARLEKAMTENGFSQQQIEDNRLSMYDVLIVASLIEKESAIPQENAIIASVIYNRLCSRTYPCLNIDATIQYILPERKLELSKQDTTIDSPYNTYKYPGLPVGAIASPGLSAIRGALFPRETEYYFYALSDEGTHIFSETYDEHLKVLGSVEDTNE